MVNECLIEIDLGTFQPSMLNPQQYSLEQSQDSSTRVSTIACIADLNFHIHLTFIPFCRSCNFVYHEYQIQISVPNGDLEGKIDSFRGALVGVAQALYERHFKRAAGYPFTFSKTE